MSATELAFECTRRCNTSRSTHTCGASSSSVLLLLLILLSGAMLPGGVVSLGINYGQIANNLPTPDKVVGLVKSIGANKVKLYDADPKVLKAFAKTGMEFTVSLGNEYLSQMKDPKAALDWVKKNVQCHLPDTNITCILIGNEVLTFNDTSLTTSLLPAMQNIHEALVSLQLDRQVWVTTAHNLAILETSYPPSAGAFRSDLSGCLTQILNFHTKTGSPFMINAYPYFAYKASPNQVPLDYVLFQSNKGMLDPSSNLHYDNMLFAQVDAVYSAMGPNYNKRVSIQVSETGWPSKGDDDEAGATPENAKKYNGNLIKLINNMSQGQRKGTGTPMRPNCDLNIFIFALFNENMKPGPTSERNYGLFKPDATPAYSLGFPIIQTLGNTSTGSTPSATAPPATTTATSPSSSSSSGYLSISSATERCPSAGFLFISALLSIKLLMSCTTF